MSEYTDADLERAKAVVIEWDDYHGPGYEDVAEFIAAVRNETIERCAVEIEQERTTEVPLLQHLAQHLRALKAGGK